MTRRWILGIQFGPRYSRDSITVLQLWARSFSITAEGYFLIRDIGQGSWISNWCRWSRRSDEADFDGDDGDDEEKDDDEEPHYRCQEADFLDLYYPGKDEWRRVQNFERYVWLYRTVCSKRKGSSIRWVWVELMSTMSIEIRGDEGIHLFYLILSVHFHIVKLLCWPWLWIGFGGSERRIAWQKVESSFELGFELYLCPTQLWWNVCFKVRSIIEPVPVLHFDILVLCPCSCCVRKRARGVVLRTRTGPYNILPNLYGKYL